MNQLSTIKNLKNENKNYVSSSTSISDADFFQ